VVFVKHAIDIYCGRDPIEMPAYSVPEVARVIRVPKATVRSWVRGRRYPTAQESRRLFEPVIDIADPETSSLSFQNLVELHVLSAIRRQHGVRLNAIRRALKYLRSKFKSEHPLADVQMHTDGSDLFVHRYGELVNASDHGQMAMKACLGSYLDRIERDTRGNAIRLYPFTTNRDEANRRGVVIDPRVQFGRPCLAGTGVPTALIAERHQAGDSIRDIAEDYSLQNDAIEEAIRYESLAA
jgi:uncharacterized protein (DUF433 family)